MTQQTDHVPDGRKKGVTAVEWFYQRILAKNIKEVYEEAKAMERRQILDAHENGQGVVHNPYAIWRISDKAEEYYNELYNK